MTTTRPQAGSDHFVPLVSKDGRPSQSVFSALELKAPQTASLQAAFEPLPANARREPHATESCPEPTVTLRREGDVISAIRIQCGCGRVLELNCVY